MTHLEALVDIGSALGASVAGQPFDVARRELIDALKAVARGFDDATDGSVLAYADLLASLDNIGRPQPAKPAPKGKGKAK